MKIIKLVRANNISLNKRVVNTFRANRITEGKHEFDLSKYKNIKNLSKDDIAKKIAIKNGISIDEIKKEYRNELELKYEQNFNLFIEKTIIDSVIHYINNYIFNNDKVKLNSDFNPFLGWHQNHRFNEKTKTIEVLLSYKNRINFEICQRLESIEINENFLKERRKLKDGTFEKFTKSKFLKWWGKSSWDSRIEHTKRLKKDLFSQSPKYIKHWINTEGKKEIELIEKSLEDLGKIKLEVYNVKNKKINTLYIKFTRLKKVYSIDEISQSQYESNCVTLSF